MATFGSFHLLWVDLSAFSTSMGRNGSLLKKERKEERVRKRREAGKGATEEEKRKTRERGRAPGREELSAPPLLCHLRHCHRPSRHHHAAPPSSSSRAVVAARVVVAASGSVTVKVGRG
ncbi:uncharacterized protein DS421_3g95640 [Arachis hypogaea]|nr:uncharacterized protein DS421_3g95640 [Arachis hypogaea]